MRPPGRLAARLGLLMAGALVGEVVLRVLFAWAPVGQHLRSNSSLSWQRIWLAEHARGRAVAEPIDRYHPLLGWVTRAHLTRYDLWNGKTLTTDSLGARPARDAPLEARSGELTLLTLGDSFTFGEEVGDAECWPSRLESSLGDARVINLGVHGYGHDQMLLLFRARGVRTRPDAVLVGFVETDISRNALTFRDYAKPRFRQRGDRLELRNVPVPLPRSIARAHALRPRWIDLGELLVTRLRSASGLAGAEKRRLTARILAELAREIREAGALDILVELPIGEALRSENEALKEHAEFERICRAGSWSLCLTTGPELRAADPGATRLSLPSGHWAPFAHRLAAASVARELDRLAWRERLERLDPRLD